MTMYYSISEAFDAWRRTVSEIQPEHDEEHISSVWNTVLLRSQMLANVTPLEFSDIATFLINHTLVQIRGGVSLMDIEDRLPSSPQEYFLVLGKYLGPKYDSVIAALKTKIYH